MHGQNNRFYTLDLLRFAAAFGVVLYHYTARPDGSFEVLSELTRFGYLGVPIFFMISGFVIAMSATGRTAYQFGVSRFARLYPGLWAGILFTLAVCYLVTGQAFDAQQVIANFTLLNDYLGQPDIDGVYWTLHTELKFYVCVFLLVSLGVFQRYRLWLSVWLTLSAVHMATDQPWFMGWFISPAWSPFFIIGVAIYHIHIHGLNRFNTLILGGALTLALIRTYMVADGFMSSPSLLESLITSCLIAVFAGILLMIALGKFSVARSDWVVVAGALTYPVYLVHNRAGKAIIDASTDVIPEWLAVSLTIALMLLVSYGIYRFVEQPLGQWIRRVGFSPSDKLPTETPAAQEVE